MVFGSIVYSYAYQIARYQSEKSAENEGIVE